MPASAATPLVPVLDPGIAAAARLQPVAVIDLAAIRDNFRVLDAASGQATCAAMVKGDGYGLGMLAVANEAWAAGARLFFVARVHDGLDLRKAMPKANIAVLDGLSGYLPEVFEAASLTPVLGAPTEVRAWCSARRRMPYIVHIDTAMNRLGLKLDELASLVPLLTGSSHEIAAYLTHFASADEGDRTLCALQVQRFRSAVAGLPTAPLSIVNSSGLFLDSAWRADITRPGKALYGIEPQQPGAPSPVRQALTVLAPILQVGEVAAGDSIGYSATFRAKKPMRIATLGVGYANGYLRALSNRGVAAFAGIRAPVVGRVSMDLVTVDVSDLPDAAFGDGYAELTGPTIGLTELSRLAISNEYELQIALGRGVKRIYTGATKPD